MAHTEWLQFARQLAQRVRYEGDLTLSVDDIMTATRVTDSSIRGRSFWRSNQRGLEECDAFTRAGLALDFRPDDIGEPVQFVTFRLA